MTDHTYAGYTAEQIRAAAESGLWSQFINVARPETVLALLDRIAELEADKRALRIDAERYRWIRDKERFHIDGECGDAEFSSSMCCAEEFDDALDDAMAQPAE